MADLIAALHLHKAFGSLQAVKDVSLSIPAGQIYGLVGADGAGKTTTIRLLCGALKGDSGETRIAGYEINRQTEEARAHIGYLSQRFSLYEDLTVLENIRFFAEVRGMQASEWRPRCMEILEFVGLAAFKDRLAGMLSGGMKQKLGLASALVTRPKVLLLDEPTTGVDPVTRQDFWQLIIRLVASPEETGEVAVLISTPYMDEAARCHRVGFMRKGALIAEGTPGQLRARLNGRVMELRGSPLPLVKQVVSGQPGVEDVRAFGDRLHLRLKEAYSPQIAASLKKIIPAGGGTFVDARPVPPTLEDVFMALAHEENQE
ncbi:MAG TPA: ABC transporter ATP-binding protein [Anaerolineaceae bacterium]|nr:ABC transporter ATP-binding protein [Anaerolineaceae bacterium]HPN50252.1 ABC transporter ATP-binding protein [Anaerolineaceae bacterium]